MGLGRTEDGLERTRERQDGWEEFRRTAEDGQDEMYNQVRMVNRVGWTVREGTIARAGRS
jgi:hypothetical protein